MAVNYDETLTRAKTLRHLNKHRESINKLLKVTRFNRDELEKLFIIHLKICLANNGIFNFIAFYEFLFTVLGITDRTHCEKLLRIFDPNLTQKVSPAKFVRLMSIMLKGTLSEQIDFVWEVYSHEGVITRSRASSCLQSAIIKRRGDAGYKFMVQDMVSYLLKKLDYDADGVVTKADFKKTVQKHPLLLECLGPCLPDPQSASAFLTTFSRRPCPLRILPRDGSHVDDNLAHFE